MRFAAFLAVATLLGLGSAAVPLATAQPSGGGCTPCECSVAYCDGGTTYWPHVRNHTLQRVGDTATVSFRMTLEAGPGKANPNATWQYAAPHIAYGNRSHSDSADGAPWMYDYPYVLEFRNHTYSVAAPVQSFVILWPTRQPLFLRVYTTSDASEELSVPARTSKPGSESGDAAGPAAPSAFVALLGAACAWAGRRRP